MGADGAVRPAGGTLSAYEIPSGPGVRVDGFGSAGYRTSARYDSLLAKVIVHVEEDDLGELAAKAGRALADFRIEGTATNVGFLQLLLQEPAVRTGDLHTDLVNEVLAAAGGAPSTSSAGSSTPRRRRPVPGRQGRSSTPPTRWRSSPTARLPAPGPSSTPHPSTPGPTARLRSGRRCRAPSSPSR